jgi:hypothetical protein
VLDLLAPLAGVSAHRSLRSSGARFADARSMQDSPVAESVAQWRTLAASLRLTPKRSRDDGAGRLLDVGEVLRTSE